MLQDPTTVGRGVEVSFGMVPFCPCVHYDIVHLLDRFMICGGAPLHGDTQAVIKSALDLLLLQGYGATETTGAAICMDFDDLSYGCVGAPLNDVKLRLKDWPEGGYHAKDKPNPRGEILIGGDSIVQGYFKLPRQTDESFFTDRYGIRWFETGDIGELYPNGTVKIIDRRKDLIKLQNGEYISLGKVGPRGFEIWNLAYSFLLQVETALKQSQYVDNICVYGGTFSSDIVALITPIPKSLNELAAGMGKSHLTLAQMCDDPDLEQAVFNDLALTGKAASLGKKEIPVRIKLVSDDWTTENGILTAALKLKRKAIESRYEHVLHELYHVKHHESSTVGKGKTLDKNNNTELSGVKIVSSSGTSTINAPASANGHVH